MPASDSFEGLKLPGGFRVVAVEFVIGPLADAIGRPALAKSIITGKEVHLAILMSLSDQEKSVTIYHEILEALTVAFDNPPARYLTSMRAILIVRPTRLMINLALPLLTTSAGCCIPTIFGKNSSMDHGKNIQVELIKLVSGDRLLRLTYGPLGLALEKKLDPKLAVVRQKQRLLGVFEAALAQAELSAA